MLKRIIALFFTILTIFTLCISVSAKKYYNGNDITEFPDQLKPYLRFIHMPDTIRVYPILYREDFNSGSELVNFQKQIISHIPCLEDIYDNFTSLKFSNDLSIECERSYKDTTYYLNYQNNRIRIVNNKTFVQSKLKFSLFKYNNRILFTYSVVSFDDSEHTNVISKPIQSSYFDNVIIYNNFEEIPNTDKLYWGFDSYPHKIFYLDEKVDSIKIPFISFFTNITQSIYNGFNQIFFENGSVSNNGYIILIVIGLFFAISIVTFIFKLFRR